MHILNNWPQYFKERHEGLGTTYERFVLHHYFEKLRAYFGVGSVLEVPSFGMTGVSGINSMWWAGKGIPVSVVDHDEKRIESIRGVWEEMKLSVDCILSSKEYDILPFQDNAFDMGWNFASLSFASDLRLFLRELTRVSKRVIFICIPNRFNIFAVLRAKAAGSEAGIQTENTNPHRIKAVMADLQWEERDHGTFDVPPWPDIAMNKEQLLRKMGLIRLAAQMEKREGNGLCILDYFAGENSGMEEDISRYGFLEDLPEIIKRYWAHHQFFIFSPKRKAL